MMVLTLNSGSTSVKLAAYDLAVPADNGTAGPFSPRAVAHQQHSGNSGGDAERSGLLNAFLGTLGRHPDVMVHRVVHGGTRFTGPTLVDDSVIRELQGLSELAPLHNPKALEWITTARALCGAGVAQVATFDTAWFSGLPRVATEYALPRSLGLDQGVRRYGFHGLAHEALWRRWCELSPELPRGGRLISLQLGGGCSITASASGRPVDTSMGFSPLEGLVMATRSGDVDPAIIPYLQRRLQTTSERILDALNRESGLAGLSGTDRNPGELLADDQPQAQFAVELYCYRVRKFIGAYLAVLSGCDGIVFGGGVGEHVPGVRERILAGLSWAGIDLDSGRNEAARGSETRLDTGRGAVKIYALPVEEELVMVRAALTALQAV